MINLPLSPIFNVVRFGRLTAMQVFLNTTLRQGGNLFSGEFKADFCQTFNARIVVVNIFSIFNIFFLFVLLGLIFCCLFSVYQKAEVCAQTIKWRVSKRSVVLLRRQGPEDDLNRSKYIVLKIKIFQIIVDFLSNSWCATMF